MRVITPSKDLIDLAKGIVRVRQGTITRSKMTQEEIEKVVWQLVKDIERDDIPLFPESLVGKGEWKT